MITPILRLKLSDFLSTEYETDVLSKLHEINNLDYLNGVPFPLYFWYDRETEAVDLKTLEPFIKYWKNESQFNTKIIIIPELTDDQNNFIMYDIRPKGVKPANKDYMENFRFSYEYDNPRDIINGLKHFVKTYEFVNKEELNPEPTRKQKRND